MVKAVVRNGVIVPLDPLPPEWSDGQQVYVAEGEMEDDDLTPEEAERLKREAAEWVRDIQEAASQAPPGDGDILMAALDELRRQGKDQMRRKMGLP